MTTRTDLSRAAQLMGQVALPLLAATLVALLMANLVVALRWHLILLTEAPSPGPAVLLKIVLVGLFFNQVLPTGVGGDAVRVWRCSKVGIGLGAALRSILLDRACGYMVLIVVYAASLSKLLHTLADPRQKALVVVMLGAGLLGLFAHFVFDRLPRALSNLRLIPPPCRAVTRKPPSVCKTREMRGSSRLISSRDWGHHPRIRAPSGWYRQPSFLWKLARDRATRHFASAIAYITS